MSTETVLAPDLTIEEAVFQALGAASACWETLGNAGVFDSTRCKQIGDELLARIGVEKAAAPDSLLSDIAAVLNRHSRENASNTPDFILAGVMVSALTAYEQASNHRERWYSASVSVPHAPED